MKQVIPRVPDSLLRAFQTIPYAPSSIISRISYLFMIETSILLLIKYIYSYHVLSFLPYITVNFIYFITCAWDPTTVAKQSTRKTKLSSTSMFALPYHRSPMIINFIKFLSLPNCNPPKHNSTSSHSEPTNKANSLAVNPQYPRKPTKDWKVYVFHPHIKIH